MKTNLYLTLSNYNVFVSYLVAARIPGKNILVQIRSSDQPARRSTYANAFYETIDLVIDKYFFTRRSELKRIRREVLERVSVKDLESIVIAQDLDARVQYVASFYPDAKIAVLEDGVSSYAQHISVYKIIQRLFTYKMFLRDGYKNILGMGMYPANEYFAFDIERCFPRVKQRSKIRGIELPKGQAPHHGASNCVLVVTQPLVEDGYASTIDERRVLEAVARMARSAGVDVLIRPHPRESIGEKRRRAGYFEEAGVPIHNELASSYEVVEEYIVLNAPKMVVGFCSTALFNAKRIAPQSLVVCAAEYVSRIPNTELLTIRKLCENTGVKLIKNISEIAWPDESALVRR